MYFARGASDVDPVMGRFEEADGLGADVVAEAGAGAEVFVSLILSFAWNDTNYLRYPSLSLSVVTESDRRETTGE